MATDNTLPLSIDLALNEATWWGITLDRPQNRITLGFDAFTLSERADDAGQARVTVALTGVHRFVVSLRNGRWDDNDASVETCSEPELSAVVQSFGGSPIYGWEFFDLDDESWERWGSRLSLDSGWLPGPSAHSVNLFLEGSRENRVLDFRAWFDGLVVTDSEQQVIPLDAFAAGGKRWWDGLYAGDPRTGGFGIVPLRESSAESHDAP